MYNSIFSTRTIILFSTFIFTSYSYATVGGGQTLEILGYDTKEQKVYLLRDFEDARGRTPQLYYYNLKSKNPDQLIEVKSIYINPKTGKVDYDSRWDEVNQSINSIKKRLQPLSSLQSAPFQINSTVNIKSVKVWDDPHEQTRQYQYNYSVTHASLKSKPHQAISYSAGLTLSQAYKIPNHDKVIVTIRYLAFPEETSYTTEDAVMLTR